MARSSFTVERLAKEAGVDLDEALILLWDGGIDYVERPASKIRRSDTTAARELLGLATKRELASIDYWQASFGLDAAGFNEVLRRLGILVIEQRRLSNKEIRRLQSEFTKRDSRKSPAASPVKSQRKRRTGNEPKKSISPPAAWKIIGQERQIHFLVDSDVSAIHYELVKEFALSNDPISPPGVRDDNLLGSAVARPHTEFGGERKYPSVEMASAALLHSLIHNHPFHNGNKRTALVSMLAFLDLNGLLVTCSERELFRLVLRLAQHSIVLKAVDQLDDREVLYVADWVRKYSRPIELGDRNIPFRRLRKLLIPYVCEYDAPRANQIYIRRKVKKKRLLLRDTEQTLSTRAPYRNEGKEIGKLAIARVRKELEIDEPNGIDSATFYNNAPAAAGDFIIKHRKTLRRLARL